jgi:2-methylfumaryl-CoA hydratase
MRNLRPVAHGGAEVTSFKLTSGYAKWNFNRRFTYRFDDYAVGEKSIILKVLRWKRPINWPRGFTRMRRVHFNQFAETADGSAADLWGPRHHWRGLSFNGLANAYHIAAINGGRHVAPLFAGGTVFAWSEIVDKATHGDVGALRIITRATRDLPCSEFPTEDGTPEKPGVILELDYWALIPR